MPSNFVLLPVETQSRELDAKLLLACYLARAGMSTVIGSRQAMHNNIASLPRGIYMAKDFRRPSLRIFRILHGRGCPILAWDEEGVVFYNREFYHRRRVDATALGQVDELFAWNDENRDMLRSAPGYNGAPIHVTGNPRTDLLLPRLRGIFNSDVETLRERFGTFVLINTNFGRVNPGISTRTRNSDPDRGMSDPALAEFVRGTDSFRRQIFEAFLTMVPALADAFPEIRFVVRPHVAENYQVWRDLADGHSNLSAIHEGNVYPWILAGAATIHNGCTTGVEAFLLDRPVISYRPFISDEHEIRLPNMLSATAPDFDDLAGKLSDIMAGEPVIDHDKTLRAEARRVFPNLNGKLAAEHIATHVANFAGRETVPRDVGWLARIGAGAIARKRKWKKQLESNIPGHKNNWRYSHQRFPGVTLEEMTTRRNLFDSLTGDFAGITVKSLGRNLFMVSAERKSSPGRH